MYTVEQTQEIVSQLFDDIHWDDEPTGLYTPIGYVLALGGKRIRPTLTLLAANLFTDNIQSAISAAIGLEIFHNFTLLHDDIMDKAPVRRNQPTVHIKWNESTAILSGDAMLIKAYQYIAQIPEEKLTEALALFSKTALEVCEGQQLDMDFESRKNVSEEEYLEMIRLKTAVLLAACLKIGALVGGADADDAQQLYDFGINIGLAFQLKDDLLDVYGNPKTFGKQIGGDILCNKKTYLLIKALDNADSSQNEKLAHWLSEEKTENPETKIKAVTEIYNQTGTKTICEEKMDEYFAIAMNHLAKVNVQEDKKKQLSQLANKLMFREV
jgi:geranylgeranyl diphosphate synthase type II